MAEDRSKPLPYYPAPPLSQPPQAMHMPPLESSHDRAMAAATTAASDQHWVYSNTSQASPVPPTHGFPTISNQELLQLPPNGPYGRPNSLLGSAMMPPDAHHHHLPPPLGNYHVNGNVASAPSYPSHHNAPPHSAPLKSANVEPPTHSIPPQYPTPVPAPTLQTPASSDAPYQDQVHGMRQKKVSRAQQACNQCRVRKTKCDEGRPSCSHCEENNLPCVYKDTVPPYKCSKQVDQGLQLSCILAAKAKAKEARVIPSQNPVRPASQKQVINPMMKPDMPDVLHDQGIKEKNTSFVVNQDIDAAEGVKEGLKDDDRELSIPVEHTPAAHKLLMWPSVKALLYPMEYDEDYVINLEKDRSMVRVYGQGEGDDTNEGAQQRQQPSMPNMSSHSTPDLDEGSPPAGSPSGATWGAPGRTTPATPGTSVRTVEHGIEESGIFTTDSTTVHRLHFSYTEHMHKLHPFLDQNNLEEKIEMFICMYCSSASMFQPRIERSIDNAVILLVLALGSICECHDCPLPGPVSRGHCNVDVIPGLAYYGYATQILGSLQGGNGLPHVQAALLASLYAGQLAHPFQSHGWICQAAWACQVLVQRKRYDQIDDGPRKDLYNFAYWTCLQLESDILAELDLPASGISHLEDRINLPKEICAPSTMMVVFYSAQIHLRKILNRVHTDLYKVNKQGQHCWSSKVQEILSMNLQQWQSSLPKVMQWEDYDPPSKDINAARMRANYYGACYIIHRPLLYHALHIARCDEGPGPVQSSITMPVGGWTSCTYRDLPTKLQRACEVCIDSAILSMEAFDGIEGRPVVTNIFGTAHAQFGNMLVLSTTYMSSLSELVDYNVLRRLLKRTIRSLSQHISPSLQTDTSILVEVYKKIFSEPPESFSSF
ncbi:hypothetical protein SI65_04147 [Aspergillus cristatus]|uniref:Zn(2)-C6 fungal-type domain-containing protein n=1 Tax=Aspergillus cristatus TaxID=573508 RepID=A0A1E3BJG5_ASPCR|nr:hypothetical protein SI65_04147 [Aspergillus cristatus]